MYLHSVDQTSFKRKHIKFEKTSNMIFRQLFLICIIEFIAAHAADDNKNEKCMELKTHYLELGCTPVYSATNKKCPERYDCPFMKSSFDKRKCHYNSKVFNIGEKLKNKVNKATCTRDCMCREEHDGRGIFSCARIECAEHFRPPQPNCILQYKLNECCSYKTICLQNEIDKLKTCKWEEKDYKEGQMIFPSNTNKKCICTQRFDGTLQSLDCAEINCGVEIYYTHYVYDKCAPVYLQNRDICPIYWNCWSDSEKVEENAVKSTTTDPEMKCHYGDKKLSVGDKVTTTDKCVTCSCKVPPMITCIRALDC